MELTNQIETPGCSNFDLSSNKNELMLTIKNKTELDNSKTRDGKQILNTLENTSKNSNATKTQENSNRVITVLPRKCMPRKTVSKAPVIIKNYTYQPDFKREIVTQQSKS